MNFKKTWKRFMNMSRSREGFTLVELIVVIAILAILAGVAIPVYSGYIAKANEAADQQLLGVVNTAFGAACLENNLSVQALTNADLSYGGTAGAVTVTGVASVNGAYNADVDASFKTYFAGNETSTFKTIVKVVFDPAKDVFVDPSKVDSVTVYYKGTPVNVSGDALVALQGSSFGAMGAPILLGQVDKVSGIAQGMLDPTTESSLFKLVYGNDLAYLDQLKADLNMSDDEWGAICEQVMADKGCDPQTAMNTALANSLVLNVAKNTQDMNTDNIISGLKDGSFTTGFVNNLRNESTAQEGLAQAAVAYGLYASYLHSEKGQTPDISNLSTLESTLNSDTDFKAYIQTEQAQKDLDAYLKALNVVNDSTQDKTTASAVLANGFADPELVTLMGSLMGN